MFQTTGNTLYFLFSVKGTVSRDFCLLVYFIKKLLLVRLQGRFCFLPKNHRDIGQKVGSAVYDTPRNGDSALYHTPRNGDLAVYHTPRNDDSAVYIFGKNKIVPEYL